MFSIFTNIRYFTTITKYFRKYYQDTLAFMIYTKTPTIKLTYCICYNFNICIPF